MVSSILSIILYKVAKNGTAIVQGYKCSISQIIISEDIVIKMWMITTKWGKSVLRHITHGQYFLRINYRIKVKHGSRWWEPVSRTERDLMTILWGKRWRLWSWDSILRLSIFGISSTAQKISLGPNLSRCESVVSVVNAIYRYLQKRQKMHLSHEARYGIYSQIGNRCKIGIVKNIYTYFREKCKKFWHKKKIYILPLVLMFYDW